MKKPTRRSCARLPIVLTLSAASLAVAGCSLLSGVNPTDDATTGTLEGSEG